MKPTLGVCYYPEHWSPELWPEDARRMREAGLSVVRIGEFAWSRIEPSPGQLDWQWLDQAVNVLGEAGLQVVLGTPTATPPRWMLNKHPNMLAVDVEGKPRKFGSRRHYCFSYLPYYEESKRIVSLMAERYASSTYVMAWQTDNEYGCHDTVVSYSAAALEEFQLWLEKKYASVDRLNEAWGNVFWSMEYGAFAEVDLPNLAVTEVNPAHQLDFRRFSSDQVVAYNRMQVDAIREHSEAPIAHNYMGRIVEFDHYAVGQDLEIASWDSYPLGFLEDRSDTTEEWRQRFYRQGDPDFQAFHHDLYRTVGHGRWWVMEQQPGPVNWAPFNPAPLPGMVRLWTWEAIAHQAETVCYFRWRQAPFAQEQMHAGLLRPDSADAPAIGEAKQVHTEIEELGEIEHGQAQVALIFDYESCWAWQTQPQGQSFDGFALALSMYRGLRRLGLSIDILPPSTRSLSDYKLVLIPGLLSWPASLLAQLEEHQGAVLVGPRSGSKTEHFAIPAAMPPNLPMLDCKVAYVESLRDGATRLVEQGGEVFRWLEHLESNAPSLETMADGSPLLVGNERIQYLGGWPNEEALHRILLRITEHLSVDTIAMPEGVRQRQTASHKFTFNYNAEAVEFKGDVLPPTAVTIEPI